MRKRERGAQATRTWLTRRRSARGMAPRAAICGSSRMKLPTVTASVLNRGSVRSAATLSVMTSRLSTARCTCSRGSVCAACGDWQSFVHPDGCRAVCVVNMAVHTAKTRVCTARACRQAA